MSPAYPLILKNMMVLQTGPRFGAVSTGPKQQLCFTGQFLLLPFPPPWKPSLVLSINVLYADRAHHIWLVCPLRDHVCPYVVCVCVCVCLVHWVYSWCSRIKQPPLPPWCAEVEQLQHIPWKLKERKKFCMLPLGGKINRKPQPLSILGTQNWAAFLLCQGGVFFSWKISPARGTWCFIHGNS